jgi:hypothetical protein
MIPKEDLETGQYYVGEGRFMGSPCVAMWDGRMFVGLSFSMGYHEANYALYGDEGFTPLKSVLKV